MTSFAVVSQIANHCQISCCNMKFFTLELTNVTSQNYVTNIDDPWKY